MNIFYLLLILMQSSNWAFNLSVSRWSSNSASVTFSSTMVPDDAPELKNGVWIDLTKESYTRWTSLSNVKFDLTYSTEDCAGSCEIANDINEIYWYPPNYAPVFLPPSALGVTLRRSIESLIVEADIIFNTNFDLALNLGMNTVHGFCVNDNGDYFGCYDFPSVATHEIGHFFGIDHTSEDDSCPNDTRRSATMYYSLNLDDVSLISLETDDISAMTCVYPLTGVYYHVPECCLSQNPFDRAENCAHSFSSESQYSLDIGNNTAGCGYIDSKNDNNNFRGGFFFIIFIPIFILLLLKLFKRKLIYKIIVLLFVFIITSTPTEVYAKNVVKQSVKKSKKKKIKKKIKKTEIEAEAKPDTSTFDIDAEIKKELEINDTELNLIEQNLKQKQSKQEINELIPEEENEFVIKPEPIIEKEKTQTEKIIENYNAVDEYKTKPFMTGLGIGLIFSKESYLSKIFEDLRNSGIENLTNINVFFLVNLEAGKENLYPNFDMFIAVGYYLSMSKKGSGAVTYGLEPIDTSVSSRMYGIPFSLTGRYRFINFQRVRIGASVASGFWVSRAFVDININEVNSQSITNSLLKFGGVGYLGEINAFAEVKLNSFLVLELQLGYNLMVNSRVKILESSGNFDKQFIEGKRLMFYNSETGTSDAFKLSMSGIKTILSIKSLF